MNAPAPNGFTLIESLIAGVILATGVLSIVAAQQAFHRQNDAAEAITMGLSLANEIRETMLGLPAVDPVTGALAFGPETDEASVTQYDDLDDFAGGGGAGVTFSPPINALRQSIADLPQWQQFVIAEPVSPSDITGSPVSPGATDVLRMTVIVSRTETGAMREVTRLSWLAAAGP